MDEQDQSLLEGMSALEGTGISIKSITTELRRISDTLVQNSLSQYVAYGLKEVEALAYLSDPKTNVPLLVAEAEIRGVTVEELAKLVQDKGEQMKKMVRSLELLRVELASRYEEAPNKLALRDEILEKAKALQPKA